MSTLSPTMGQVTISARRVLLVVLAVALLLRLAYALSQDHLIVYGGLGGDSGWYLDYGLRLVTATVPAPPPPAPLYLIFLGWWQRLLAPETAIIVVRIIQAILGTATCCFAWRIGRIVAGDDRAGLLAAGVLAVSPAFVTEAAQITTETLYIFFVSGGLWAYLELAGRPACPPGHIALMMAIVGLIFGLATLTRAVSLLFPLGLALHFALVVGWRAAIKPAVLMLLIYGLVVSIWTVYNLASWGYFVVGAQGLTSFLYLGTQPEGWQGWEQVDSALEAGTATALPTTVAQQQGIYAEAAVSSISSDPLGWLGGRMGNLAEAYLQPHGTVVFPGDSLKDAALNWLREDRTPGGLLRLTRGDYFWPKLVIYLLHYTGLVMGLAGLWLSRRRWQVMLPLAGFVLYTTLIHLLLLALPRYVFPTELFWWVFASVALVEGGRRLGTFRRPAVSGQQPSTAGSQ